MPTTVSDYFLDELLEWNESAVFYIDEIEFITQKLGDVVRRNSVIGIAEKVEAQQIRINQSAEKFHRLQSDIRQQENALRSDSMLIEDALIGRETDRHQVDLRVKMHAVEKEYIDIKFDCYHFLAGTLKK